jgi:hypothetical protein
MGFLDKYNRQEIEDSRESTGEFRQFPVGENEAVITGIQEKVSSNDNDMLEITFGNESGAEIRAYIVDGEWAAGKLKNLQTSFGIPYGEKNTGKWIGKRGIVIVREGEPYNGKIYNKVSHYRSIKPAGTAAAPKPAAARQAAAPAAGKAASVAPRPAAPAQPEPESLDDILF